MKTPFKPRRIVAAQWWVAITLLTSGLATRSAELPKLPPLTTVPGSERLPGKFVWADLVTDDAGAAATFYSKLLGWTFRDYGGYFIASNDERPLAGIFQRPRPEDKPEASPRWFAYLSVSNVGRAQREVTDGGGRVLAAPQKLPKRGEQAVFADPEGALFGVVKSSAGDPEDFLAAPGDWIWIQLLSRDARKAAEFYRSVGGYEVVENTESSRPNDFVLTSHDFARAAVLTIPEGHENLRPGWLPFVRVDSANDSVAKTKRLGGRVLLAPNPKLFGGRLAVIADPTGAAIGLLEWSQAELGGAASP
jgi:predicted enzyme related to lactoylglutathione lyase